MILSKHKYQLNLVIVTGVVNQLPRKIRGTIQTLLRPMVILVIISCIWFAISSVVQGLDLYIPPPWCSPKRQKTHTVRWWLLAVHSWLSRRPIQRPENVRPNQPLSNNYSKVRWCTILYKIRKSGFPLWYSRPHIVGLQASEGSDQHSC